MQVGLAKRNTVIELNYVRFVAAASVIIFISQCLLYYNVILDDPFITFRYAKNLATGHGLVWNAGEPPVEGFTELIWTLGSALAITLGISPLIAMKITGLMCGATILSGSYILSRRIGLEPATAVTALLCLAMTPVLSFYSVSAMGHPLFVVLLGGAVLATVMADDQPKTAAWLRAGLLFGLSALARPEGLGFFLVAAGVVAVWRWSDPARMTILSRFFAGFAALYLPLLVWRVATFGLLFPNTFYAKHTGGGAGDIFTGLIAISDGLKTYLGLFFLVSLLSVGARAIHGRVVFAEWLMWGVGLAGIGYVILLGGDDFVAFPSHRLLLPAIAILLPVCWLSIQHLYKQIIGTWPAAKRAFPVVAAVTALVYAVGIYPDAYALVRISNPVSWKTQPSDIVPLLLSSSKKLTEKSEISRWFMTQGGPNCSIALPTVGRIAYETPCRIIDVLGLNDSHIAMMPKLQRGIDMKGDPEYVLSLKPQFIVVQVDREVPMGKKTFEEGRGFKINDRVMLEKIAASGRYRLREDAPGTNAIFQRIGEP